MNDWILGGLGIAGGLLVAVLIGWAGSSYSVVAGGWPVFVLCGVFAYLVQWLMFVHAWVKRTEHYFDLTGSITYIVMVVSGALLSGASDPRSLLLVALIVVWALRLGPFLFLRIRKAGEDRRFRSIKASFPVFLMTWTLQGTWVFITACCALAAITSLHSVPIDVPFWIGLSLWVFGFVIEVTADQQKSAFRAKPENADRFIRSGLWAWSRHPNYFGEIVLWLGIAMIAYPVLVGWQLVTLISPLFVVVLLTFISGVRMLENRADKTWGDDPEYQAYKRNTPVLMLWPPRS
jgi:steroid 5-alpha reductase family enzyme